MSPRLSLEQLCLQIEQIALNTATPHDLLPTYGKSEDFGRPHIELTAGGYAYVIVERGTELERTEYDDSADLYFHVFQDALSSQATRYATKHRVTARDFRRPLFAEKIRLAGIVSEDWKMRTEREIARILLENPFVD